MIIKMHFMKRILLVCVNYNTYDYLSRFLDSIDASLKEVPKDELELSICIADNSSQKQKIELSKYTDFNINVYILDNLGYFGGALFIINQFNNISRFDFVIISNVDILFKKNTLLELIHAKIPQNVAWISPQRYSTKYNMVLKVEKKSRPSKLKMWLYLYMYKSALLKRIQHIYTFIKYKSRSKTFPEKEGQTNISKDLINAPYAKVEDGIVLVALLMRAFEIEPTKLAMPFHTKDKEKMTHFQFNE